MRQRDVMRAQLMATVQEMLEDASTGGSLVVDMQGRFPGVKTEVIRVSDKETQIRVTTDNISAPRYFLISVKESL